MSTAEESAALALRFVGVQQAEFARQHGVPGGPSMVSQHIKGRRPINMDAALAYAKGFQVPLGEISPRLAAQAAAAAEIGVGKQPQMNCAQLTDPAALLQALATHISQADPERRQLLISGFTSWVAEGAPLDSIPTLVGRLAPPQAPAQETPRRAA